MNEMEIISCGLYVSKACQSNVKITDERKIESFEFDYIISCDEGACSFLDDSCHKLLPDLLVMRKPGQRSHSRLHYKCYFLHLNVETESPVYEELLTLPNYYPLLNKETYRPLYEELFQHCIKKGNTCGDYYISAKLFELFYHLQKDKTRNTKSNMNTLKKERDSLQKAILYMKNNFKENITLKLLGELFGYSPNYFQHIFTQIMEVTPQQYVENLRIVNAKYLLARQEISLAQIAYECGFSSQAYFSKIFKKHTLLSPREYRRAVMLKAGFQG